MTTRTSQRLDAGDRFPSMTLQIVGGDPMAFPDDLGDRWGVLLIYRGHW